MEKNISGFFIKNLQENIVMERYWAHILNAGESKIDIDPGL